MSPAAHHDSLTLSRDLSAGGGHRALLRERQIRVDNELLHRRLSRLRAHAGPMKTEQVGFEQKFRHDRDTLLRNRALSRMHEQAELQSENLRIYRRLQRAHAQQSASGLRQWYQGQLPLKPKHRPPRDRLCPPELRPQPLARQPAGSDSDFASRPRSEALSVGRGDRVRGAGLLGDSLGSSIASELPSNWRESLDSDTPLQPYISFAPPQLLPPMERLRSRRRRRARKRSGSSGDGAEGGPEKGGQSSNLEVEEPQIVPDAPAEGGFHFMDASSDALVCGEDASLFDRVVGWEFAIPNNTRNCVVYVHTRREVIDDFVYLTVAAANPPYRKLSERRLSVDEMYDIVESVRSIQQVAEEDATSLRYLLRNIFAEADGDRSGHLSFSELQTLLDRINLGLSSSDLRSIVAEADVDDNGFIDYEEFLPIATDMILGYRAKARANVHKIDSVVAELVHRSINVEEIERITEFCMQQFRLSDPQQIGAISLNLFKSRINRAKGVGLSPNDIRLLCQNIPRDYKGRCQYISFKDILYDVRFMVANNAIIEAQGSELQRHLIEMCLQEERRLAELSCDDNDDVSNVVLKGTIPLRSMVDILLSSPLLALNRLQVMLLTSEANVVKGKISIYQFVPACVKTIEMMFDPQALRVRAELIEDEGDSTLRKNFI